MKTNRKFMTNISLLFEKKVSNKLATLKLNSFILFFILNLIFCFYFCWYFIDWIEKKPSKRQEINEIEIEFVVNFGKALFW